MNDPTKSIPAFYSGQSIFLTGATGFLGKVFIEKILRCCPDIREIFLLIRPKKGISIKQRLEKMLNLPLYDMLRNERPSSFEKLIPVIGNTSEKGLGLSFDDREILIERVSIIVHCAASVRFDDSLRDSVFSNLRSTRDICMLAEKMKNLLALVYISTTYTQTANPIVEEKIYPPKIDGRKMIEVAELLDPYILDIFTKKYMGNLPNTYVFAKNLAEGIIEEYSTSLPCVILRPSMVMSTLDDPVPGWLDNIYGPIGIGVGIAKSILRVSYAYNKIYLDIIPVDVLIKSLIQIIWRKGLVQKSINPSVCTSVMPLNHRITSDDMPLVFNCGTGNNKKITVRNLSTLGLTLMEEFPFKGIMWIPFVKLTTNFTFYYILVMLLHILPAVIIDLILKCSGRRPILLKLQRSIYVVGCAFGYYSMNEWLFHDVNTRCLNELVPFEDQKAFKFDMTSLDSKKYIADALLGAKKFLFHEETTIQALDAAKAHLRRIVLFVTMLKILTIVGMLWMVYQWNVLSYFLRPIDYLRNLAIIQYLISDI